MDAVSKYPWGLRAAADYVASLTEPHAIALHKRLTGAELGGFRDLV